MNNSLKITVIGAGNGGQAIAAHCAIKGYSVCLYNRNIEKLGAILNNKSIELYGAINGKGLLESITDNIQEAVNFADIIFIATTATAHCELARKMAPFLRQNQIIIFNPGRTGGLLEFKKILSSLNSNINVYLGEAQTLMYACRKTEEGRVHIIGEKERVLFSSDSRKDTEFILRFIKPIYSCFYPASNILQTSLENIGAIFHPCVILFNAAAIERGSLFYFYREMTPAIADFIQKVDKERIEIGKAYGIDLISATEWVSYAYPGIQGKTLCERMRNNPAYYDIMAPSTIYSRQLLEDIPTGLCPMTELGKLADVDVTLMDSIINICGSLLNIDFRKIGRSLSTLGLDNMSVPEIIKKISI